MAPGKQVSLSLSRFLSISLSNSLNLSHTRCIITESEVNVWDEGSDSERNIRIDPKKGVMAATFNKLVEKLTSERDHGKCSMQSHGLKVT